MREGGSAAIATAFESGTISLHPDHVQLARGEEETVPELQGETRFRPVGISLLPNLMGDLLSGIQLHGGEHLCESTQRAMSRVGAEMVPIAVHGPGLGG